jgi:hypothetical protein
MYRQDTRKKVYSMKKIFALFCIIIMSTAIFACNKKEKAPAPSSAPQITAITSDTEIADTAPTEDTTPSDIPPANTSATEGGSLSTDTSAQTAGTNAPQPRPESCAEIKYDKNNNVIYRKYLNSVGNIQKEEFFAYDIENNLTSQEEALYTYDENKNLTSISSYDIAQGGAKTLNNEIRFIYGSNGSITAEEFYILGKSSSLFLRDKTEYQYNEENILISKIYRAYNEQGTVILERDEMKK